MHIRRLINLLPPIIVRLTRALGFKTFCAVGGTTTLMELNHSTEDPKVSVPAKISNRITLENVVIDLKAGHCFDAEYSVIEETSSWPSKDLTKGTIPRPIVTPQIFHLDRFGVALPSNGFYHWLIEDLPLAIEMLEEEKSAKVLIYKNAPKYVMDFLKSFHIDFEKFPRFSKFTQLSLPIRKQVVGEPRISDMSLLRHFFGPKLHKQLMHEKVYISRLKSNRSPIFEKSLQSQLSSQGWTIVYLEELTLVDQFSIFKNASSIAGIHGAGLSGLVFAEPGTTIFEIYPYERDIKCFENLARVTGQRITRIPFASDSIQVPIEIISSLNQI